MKQKVIQLRKRRIDQTRETLGCTAPDLIRKAGEALELSESFRPRRDERIGIFSGSGHNGADALVLGELLFKKVTTSVLSCFRKEKLKPENQIISGIEEFEANPRFHEDHMGEIKSSFEMYYVIDGIFGTGKNEVTGFLRMVIEAFRKPKTSSASTFLRNLGDSGLALGAAVRRITPP